MADLSMPRSII